MTNPPAPARSRAFRRLVLLRWALVAATVLAVAASVTALAVAHTDAAAVRAGTGAAVRGVAAARTSLIAAHTAALRSFASGAAAIAGPGVTYQNEIAVASRQLGDVAETSAGGEAVQIVQGLVVTYMGMIEQAHVYVNANPRDPLAVAYCQYAGNLLHGEILVQLDALAVAEWERMQGLATVERLADDPIGPDGPAGGADPRWVAVHAFWVLSVLLLFGLLAYTQVLISRRFRRTLSLPLLLATGLAVAIGVSAGLSLRADGSIDEAHRALGTLVAGRHATDDARQSDGCAAIAEFSTRLAAGDPQVSGCPATAADAPDAASLTAAASRVETATVAAERTGSIELIVLLGALTILMIMTGMRHRIEEYRYRPR
ncbi:hypothetical protein J2S43_002720 [Catenuloplanes nepalensis]|uniref:Integral membrane protein n=1 Tax=Catenuloplanes nepalensis TaxID=587533 RepID=A0ABT9MSH1_9ACTN|nr:hypothetical protein [Catenuloplanes nepalensis]MDP9794208.1 hypothetical protein [Catenuloplanes nepalensis]